ncbi:MAG: hypothetical protein WD491_09815 [Balneolales bacterium]
MQTDLNKPELEDQIDLYLDGSLNPDEIDLLWEQLIEYPEYLDYMKTCASLLHIGRKNDTESKLPAESSGKPSTSYNFRYAIAAGLIILIAVIGILKIYPEQNAYNIQPLATLEMDNLRSSTVSDNDFDKEIQKGISLAVIGQEPQALDVLNQLKEGVTENAQEMDVLINIGIIHYNLADYESAKTTFLNIAHNPHAEPLIVEKAWWYLANSYLKTNHREDAKIAAQHTYDVNGAYRRMAARWLERL